MACKNPFGEAERARKRESLLTATEADLEKIAAACARARRPLRGKDKIALRAGKVLNRRKVAKHFIIGIGEDQLQLPPEPGLHHRRGRPGRHLRAAHQRRPRRPGQPAKSSPPTRRSPRSSGPSAPSTPTWASAPSGTAPRTGSAPTCSCACSRTTSPGTCTPGSRPSCSPTTTSQPPRPPAPARSPPPPAPRGRWPRPPPSTPMTASRCTASPACSADLATICLNTIAPADPALPGFRLVTTPTPLQRQALDLLGVSHRLGIA